MEISIIIPTYNRSDLLKRTLQGYCNQEMPDLQWELIVVSDGSTDSTQQILTDFKKKLPVTYLVQEKRGVSSARNAGLRAARSPIVLFVDDDVIPSPQLIAEHARFHAQRTAPEDVLLGYVTWLPDLCVTPFMHWYGEYGGLFGFSLLKDDRPENIRYFYSCNISMKTDFIKRNHGFNESLSVMEDFELGYRLKKNGMRMYFKRTALGFHNQQFTFREACQRLERHSDGLSAFCLTEAGRSMIKKRSRLPFRLAETFVKTVGPMLYPLRPLLDSGYRLPNAIYRLFYWYYGSYRSFWGRSTPAK